MSKMQIQISWRESTDDIICESKNPHTEILFITKYHPHVRHGITKDGITIYEMGIARDIRVFSKDVVLTELKKTFSVVHKSLISQWIYVNDLQPTTNNNGKAE